MADVPGELTPIEKLIEMRRAASVLLGAGPATRLENLLSTIEAPPRLPGLVKIARNVLEILDPDLGVPVPEDGSAHLAGWRDELRWVIEQAPTIAQNIFGRKRDRDKFLRTRGDNPVLYAGATSHPMYCQLWETHPDEKCDRGFRILQGHFMFAYFAERRRINTAEWWDSERHAQVANIHMYSVTLPLKHIARTRIDDLSGGKHKNLLETIPSACSRKDLSDSLWKFRNRAEPGRELYKDLTIIVRLLDSSLNGPYKPEPRTSGGNVQQVEQTTLANGSELAIVIEEESPSRSRSADKDPLAPTESNAIDAGPMFEVAADSDEEDDCDEWGWEADGQKQVPSRRKTEVTCFRQTKIDRKLIEQAIASGDNPGKYLKGNSIDLAKGDKGVRLQAGGWQEMRNQFLPWSLNELADEELADAWLRLEEHASSGDPESIEIFALANTLLWTGRKPKDVLPLQIVTGTDEESGEICFFLPRARSSPTNAEWRIRALPTPHSEPITVPVQNPCARLSEPFFALPDYAGVEEILRLHLSTDRPGSTTGPIFKGSASDYEALLRSRLRAQPNRRPANQLNRVTLARLGYALFQRIVDMTGGDLVAASLITGRDEQIARDDRFYAAPSVASLRQIYKDAVTSIREELVALGCPLKTYPVLESDTRGASVGSKICPTVEGVQKALTGILKGIESGPAGTLWMERRQQWLELHNLYLFYSALTIGWAVGFRAIKDPFLFPGEVDFLTGLTAFQDKGPDDESKSRLMHLPGFVLSQIRAYSEYLTDPSTCLHLFDLVGAPYFQAYFDREIRLTRISPSTMSPYLETYLPLPVNASRHFGRTEWIERGAPPEHVSAWLGHFFRGEEPWGRFSSYRFVEYSRFMEGHPATILKNLGFGAIKYDGTRIPDTVPEVESFRRRKKRRSNSLRKAEGVAPPNRVSEEK